MIVRAKKRGKRQRHRQDDARERQSHGTAAINIRVRGAVGCKCVNIGREHQFVSQVTAPRHENVYDNHAAARVGLE